MRPFLLVALALGACPLAGCTDLKFGGKAEIRGDSVVVEVWSELKPGTKTTYTVNGATQTVEGNRTCFAFPLAGLAAGSTTWPATVERGGDSASTDLTFAVPAKPDPAPAFFAIDCKSDSYYDAHKFKGEWFRDALGCDLDEQGRIALSYVATRGATVTLGGAELPPVDAPDKGLPLVARIGLAELLAALPVDRRDGSLLGLAPVELAVSVRAGGAAKESRVTVDLHAGGGAQVGAQIARDLEQGKPLSWAKRPANPDRAVALVIADKGGTGNEIVRALGTGTLADTAMVAVVRSQERRKIGECGPYREAGGDKEIMAPHYVSDQEVVLYAAQDGRQLARKGFAVGDPPCPENVVSFSKDGAIVEQSVPPEETDAFIKTHFDALIGRSAE